MRCCRRSTSNSLSSPAVSRSRTFFRNQSASKAIPEPDNAAESPSALCPLRKMPLLISSLMPSRTEMSVFRFWPVRWACMHRTPLSNARFTAVRKCGGSQIIGVHDNYYIVGYSVNGIHCHCQCFGFGAVFIVGYQQSDRQGTQELVGGRLHLVGDNDDIKHFFRIFLSQETAYGRDDYPVFFISREEYDENVVGCGLPEIQGPGRTWKQWRIATDNIRKSAKKYKKESSRR